MRTLVVLLLSTSCALAQNLPAPPTAPGTTNPSAPNAGMPAKQSTTPAKPDAPSTPSSSTPSSNVKSPLKPDDSAANYALCLETARAYPAQGLELAKHWEDTGGGDPAKHCEAVALIGTHEFHKAAIELEELGISSKHGPPLRADLLAQAAQAFTLEGDYQQARDAQTAALKFLISGEPATVPILIDRAVTYASLKQFQDALTDLDSALSIVPKNAEALAFRANAHRELYQFADALKDAEAAVAIDPNNVSALLERGIAYRLNDNPEAAKRDWEKVITIAPDSDSARAAKGHLARLEAKIDESDSAISGQKAK
jgi:tetratricopeptide (TPR) repeat protein